jgi:hypothetical protein
VELNKARVEERLEQRLQRLHARLASNLHIAGEELADVAQQLLASGHDGPSIREAAGLVQDKESRGQETASLTRDVLRDVGWRPVASTLADRLAEGLVEGLRVVVPPDVIDLTVEAGGVVIRDPDAPTARHLISFASLDEQRGNTKELVEDVTHSVLSAVQDLIADSTYDPWPATGQELPLPVTAWVGNELHAWYGAEQSPALRLPPIPLDL